MRGQPVVVVGQQRSHTHDTDGGRYHVHPDGLRKAQRLISLAARFNRPLISFIDSQGADPRLESEEQGIGNAIAGSLSIMLQASTPIVSVIIGEAGNEAALALGLSDRILMQQYGDILSDLAAPHRGWPFAGTVPGAGGGGSSDAHSARFSRAWHRRSNRA